MLEVNPYHPSLRLHGLKGRLQGLSSVSINMQYRIILEFEIRGEDIVLVDIGDHDGVY
nr:type II toxin-antitoxin system RelE/ParE family toxin [Spongiibacter marinus]